MDFGSLLYAAHKNEKTVNKDIKCYKTTFEPPKKEIKSTANLSANIQKYLQKREEEEKRKAHEEKKKKEELLALRSQDRKAFKRVQTMLKRTKSANKSVMEDAIDDVNTVVTMAGPQQCDEDDYGYVSQEASAFYAKLMDKYSSMPPEEPKFPQGKKPVVKDLNAAKDRVRAALLKEEEEEMMPHKRKRKSKSDKLAEENYEEENDNNEYMHKEPSAREEVKHKKPKKLAPPPMDFSSLLKLAEKKQFEPVKIEKKVKEEEEERPMTKKQKLEYERERERLDRKMEQENSKKKILSRKSDSLNRITKESVVEQKKNNKPSSLNRIPKKSNISEHRSISNTSNERSRRKDSYDSDNANHLNSSSDNSKNHNYSQSDRSRSNYQSNKDRSKNNQQLEIDCSRKSQQVETNHKLESYQKKYEKNIVKHTQSSIAANKIKSRNHDISDDDQSGVSDTDHDRVSSQFITNQNKQARVDRPSSSKFNTFNTSKDLSRTDSERNANSNKYSNKFDNELSESDTEHHRANYQTNDRNKQTRTDRPSSSKSSMFKSSQDISKSYSEKNGYNKRSSNNNDSEQSDSQSGNDNKNFPSKRPSDTVSHKYKPEVKFKPDKERKQFPQAKSSKRPYDEEQSDLERSCSPINKKYNGKYRNSCSDSESENEKKYISTKKHVTVSNKGMSKRSYEQTRENDDNQSYSSKIVNKHRESYSDAESADGHKYMQPKKHITSSSKEKKIKSLFEGSEDENSYHDSMQTQKEVESKKLKPSFDSERHKHPLAESKFKIPKTNSKSESSKTRVAENSERYKESERNKLSSTPNSKVSLSKDVKQISTDSKLNNPRLSSKTDTDSGRGVPDRNKEKPRVPSIHSKTENSSENSKKPSNQNPEEVLKKSASVWSKPCNLPNQKPTNSGLSESQIQRLREMNKKPTPIRPPEDRFRSVLSENKRFPSEKPSPRDERTTDGRSRPSAPLQGRPNLLKAAAAAAASRAATQKSQVKDSEKHLTSRPSERTFSEKQPVQKNLSTSTPSKDSKIRQCSSTDTKPKQFPPSDLKPRQFPPNDLKPRPFPPKDVKSRQFPPPDVRRRPKPPPRRIIDDSDEDEYDSEMDDFIDDGTDMNQEQISKEIQSIFGYDKSRYAGMFDDDDECMESNFGQIDKEEVRSLRIGAKEDYEELMKDLAEKQRRKKIKKQMMNKGR